MQDDLMDAYYVCIEKKRGIRAIKREHFGLR